MQTREPAFGLPATWMRRRRSATARPPPATPWSIATTALSTHLSETIRTFLPDLLSRQQTKEMLDQLAQTSPKLVEELVPKVVSVGDLQRVLRQLLRERVPVRDLATILEALADACGDIQGSRRADRGRPRGAWAGRSAGQYQTDKGELPVIGVLPALEEKLLASIVRTEQGPVLALDPQQAQSLASRIAEALEQAHGTARAVVLAGAASASLAAVRAGAAAPRRAVAHRGAAAVLRICDGGRSWTDMYLKTFRHKTLRARSAPPGSSSGPDALVLSTGVVHASGLRGLMGGRWSKSRPRSSATRCRRPDRRRRTDRTRATRSPTRSRRA